MKIIVVDDDKEIVELLSIYLKNEGYEPIAAYLSLIHISEPTRRTPISYAVFCLKKKKKNFFFFFFFVFSCFSFFFFFF